MPALMQTVNLCLLIIMGNGIVSVNMLHLKLERSLIKFCAIANWRQVLTSDAKVWRSIEPDTGIDKDNYCSVNCPEISWSRMKARDVVNKNAQVNLLRGKVLDQTNCQMEGYRVDIGEGCDAKLKDYQLPRSGFDENKNLLNLQHRQALEIERWLNFEKINQFKKENTHPELNSCWTTCWHPSISTKLTNRLTRLN